MLTLMYTIMSYHNQRAPYADVPGQPSQAPPPAPAASQTLTNGDALQSQPNGPSQPAPAHAHDPDAPPPSPTKDRPEVFRPAQHELARALILVEQKFEMIVNNLPGLGNSEANQLRRMRELEVDLREVEAERAKWEEVKRMMVDATGEVLTATRRVP